MRTYKMAPTFCFLVKGLEPRSWIFFQVSVNVVVVKALVKISYREQYGHKTMRNVNKVIKWWDLLYEVYYRAIVFNYVDIKYSDILRLNKNLFV